MSRCLSSPGVHSFLEAGGAGVGTCQTGARGRAVETGVPSAHTCGPPAWRALCGGWCLTCQSRLRSRGGSWCAMKWASCPPAGGGGSSTGSRSPQGEAEEEVDRGLLPPRCLGCRGRAWAAGGGVGQATALSAEGPCPASWTSPLSPAVTLTCTSAACTCLLPCHSLQ